MTQAKKRDTAESAMMSVFMMQEVARSKAEATEFMEQARHRQQVFVAARVLEPTRARKNRWIVQMYFRDDGGRPPVGMARLSIPHELVAQGAYGL